jgi:hypothetical protein
MVDLSTGHSVVLKKLISQIYFYHLIKISYLCKLYVTFIFLEKVMQNTPSNAEWRQVVQRLLKAEMSRRAVKYQDLSDRLASIGVNQSADNLRNKVNKGILGADLLLQIMFVLNVRRLERDGIVDIFSDMGLNLE